MAKITVFISHAHGESELASLLKTNLVEHFIGLVKFSCLPISRA